MHLYLDHVIIAVRDLEQAVRDYRELGFTVILGGVHNNGATQNALIAFEDGTYIELLALTGTEPLSGEIDFSVLFRGNEGLVGYALRTENIAADVARLKYAGVPVSEVTSGEQLRTDGTLVEWRVMQVEDSFSPFFIQDITLHELRVPTDLASTTHANRAVGLAGIEIAVRSMRETCERYKKILGLTQRQLDLQYARGLELKTGALYLYEAHPESLKTDWEKHLRNNGPYYSDALQQNTDPSLDAPTLASMRESGKRMLESLQQGQKREADMLAVLSNGNKSEALFSLRVIFDNTGDDRFTLDKTHEVRITHIAGVSKRRSLPVFEKMDKVDWSQVSHAYGPATDTPGWIRALVSNNKTVRDDAYEVLIGSIVHQGTVYEATLTTLPFLIELLAEPEVPDKVALLNLIGWCSGYAIDEGEYGEENLTLYQKSQYDLYHSLWRTFLTGVPIYTQLLEHPDPAVRQAASSLLSNTRQAQQDTESALLRQLAAETDPVVRSTLIQSLVYLWLPNAESKPLPRLSPEHTTMLVGWMKDLNEPSTVHLTVAACLLRYGGSDVFEEGISMLHQLMVSKPDASDNAYDIVYKVQWALESHPDSLLKWLIAQANHPIESVRAQVPFALYQLATVRRSITETVVSVLITLAHDPSVEVRFKSIIHLGKFVTAPGVQDVLKKIAENDLSIPLRERASKEVSQISPISMAAHLNYPSLHLSLEQMIATVQAAENATAFDPILQNFLSVLYELGQQGNTAAQAIPSLKRILTKPDNAGWIQLEALRALWRINPVTAEQTLPDLLPLIAFRPATIGLFQLFGEMKTAAKSALPLLRHFIESDQRGGGLQGTDGARWDIELDQILIGVAQEVIKQIERA
jgi:catechol 2,3-dioxygenase-like lactoylglutathione lyase family enzyme